MKIDMPKVECKPVAPRSGAPALLIPVTVVKSKVSPVELDGLDAGMKSAVAEVVRRYHGDAGVGAIESHVLASGARFGRIALVCVTKDGEARRKHVRDAAGTAHDWCRRYRVAHAAVWGPALMSGRSDESLAAWVEGFCLGGFRFIEMRRPKKDDPNPAPVRLTVLAAPKSMTRARRTVTASTRLAEAVNLTRHLGHQPPNVVHPESLARTCQSLAKQYKLKCTVIDDRRMRREKMGAILAVGMGSASKPRMIVLEHQGGGARSKPIVFVGKAVTLDTGGYSIKPAASIPDMKYDKQGGMAVIGALVAASLLGIKRHVVGIVGAAENMISGDAYRPGDIVRASNGTTIEIHNTDAEGRLVLADCLHYAEQTFAPSAIVDLATLTGACEVALGHACAGLMSTDDKLANDLMEAGERTDERVWRLPLWPVYREQIAGTDGDIKNVGGRPAGAITAGMFLKEFVSDRTPWAHLDIAGTATVEKNTPICPAGATGYGVRLLVELLNRGR